jgi:hypothetical protein
VDWTGRQIRATSRGTIPAHLAPILERLHLKDDRWIETVRQFGRWFKRAVGRRDSLKTLAEQTVAVGSTASVPQRLRFSDDWRGEGEDRQSYDFSNWECCRPASRRAHRLAEGAPNSVGRQIRSGVDRSWGPTRAAANRPG